jgi:1-acyl-sn-glycerol-3-phosphate acyltransferase
MQNGNGSKQVPAAVMPHWAGRLWMKMFGWKVMGTVPSEKKVVYIGAPHTSNWDFPFMLAVAAIFQVRISWMGKNSLFKQPLGSLMRRLGGIAIDRNRSTGVVTQMVEHFRQADELALVIPPSGTRKAVQYWKSGFYWIAHQAQVPIVCTYLDFQRKEAGIGLCFVPTGNPGADMDRIREFYQPIHGKHPHLETRIRLREEDE